MKRGARSRLKTKKGGLEKSGLFLLAWLGLDKEWRVEGARVRTKKK